MHRFYGSIGVFVVTNCVWFLVFCGFFFLVTSYWFFHAFSMLMTLWLGVRRLRENVHGRSDPWVGFILVQWTGTPAVADMLPVLKLSETFRGWRTRQLRGLRELCFKCLKLTGALYPLTVEWQIMGGKGNGYRRRVDDNSFVFWYSGLIFVMFSELTETSPEQDK